MGSTISRSSKNSNDYGDLHINKPSEETSYKKYQELKMERWIQMHYQIKEREQALKLARDRELFYWLSGFYLTSLFGCFTHYQRVRNSAVLVPLVPLSFIMCYFGDLAYGSKIHRIQAEADMIMQNEADLLQWPGGLPTVASIDEARVEVEMEKKMHPHHS